MLSGAKIKRWRGKRVDRDPGRNDDILDRWLKCEIESVYEDVLGEPLPPEMVRLIDRYQQLVDRRSPGPGQKDAETADWHRLAERWISSNYH